MKKILARINSFSVTDHVLLLSGLCLAISLLVYPQSPQFIGASAAIAICYYSALRLFLSFKLIRLLKLAPYAGLAVSFAYLRSYPFNPQVPAFWGMIISYIATQVFILSLFASAYKR
jgi:hypothetical protein